jgi:hypothetical protein
VLRLDLCSAVALGLPLLLLGAAAGALRVLARNPALPRGRRRALQAAWVLILLAGVPLWLIVSAVLRLW